MEPPISPISTGVQPQGPLQGAVPQALSTPTSDEMCLMIDSALKSVPKTSEPTQQELYEMIQKEVEKETVVTKKTETAVAEPKTAETTKVAKPTTPRIYFSAGSKISQEAARLKEGGKKLCGVIGNALSKVFHDPRDKHVSFLDQEIYDKARLKKSKTFKEWVTNNKIDVKNTKLIDLKKEFKKFLKTQITDIRKTSKFENMMAKEINEEKLAAITNSKSKSENFIAIEMVQQEKPIPQPVFSLFERNLAFAKIKSTFSQALGEETTSSSPLKVKIGKTPSATAAVAPEDGNFSKTRPDPIFQYDTSGAALRVASGYEVKGEEREGDPIADQMLFQEFPAGNNSKVFIFSGADGSGVGANSQNAARLINQGFMEECRKGLQKGVKSPEELCSLAIQGIQAGHDEIIAAGEGTTTHLGIIGIKEGQPPKTRGIVTSVGDMKLFIRKKDGSVLEVTRNSRTNIRDMSDPGGHLSHIRADLSNLSVFYFEAEEGDVLLPMSDGIHDNCDPEVLGMSPTEAREALIKLTSSIPEMERAAALQNLPSSFSNPRLTPQQIQDLKFLKEQYQTRLMEQKADQALAKNRDLAPEKAISEALVQHALKSTDKLRDHYIKNPQGPRKGPGLPPGKADHFSCGGIRL